MPSTREPVLPKTSSSEEIEEEELSISSVDNVFCKTNYPVEGILFAIGGTKRIMVKSIFISIETIVKVVQDSFVILN